MNSNAKPKDEWGRDALMHAVIEGNDKLVQFLLDGGAKPDSTDTRGFTALHFAAQEFRVDAARALIAAGAEVDAVDSYGNTPLWRATFHSRNRGELIQLLLESGADAHRKNLSGTSPADLAETIANYDVMRFFRGGQRH